ncbi:MAG: TIR domain-containing protein [Pseudomonadota bacterium]
MSRIVINYRRRDSAGHALSLKQALGRKFGDQHVFMDITDMQKGANFELQIDDAVKEADAMVVVIGEDWLDILKEKAASDDKEPDYVVYEIHRAIYRDKPILPVLLDNAEMPGAHDLPVEVRKLALQDAATIRFRNFQDDAEKVAEMLGEMTKSDRPPAWRLPAMLGGAVAIGAAAGIAVMMMVGVVSSSGDQEKIIALHEQVDGLEQELETAKQGQASLAESLRAERDLLKQADDDLETAETERALAEARRDKALADLGSANEQLRQTKDDLRRAEDRLAYYTEAESPEVIELRETIAQTNAELKSLQNKLEAQVAASIAMAEERKMLAKLNREYEKALKIVCSNWPSVTVVGTISAVNQINSTVRKSCS